MNIVWLLLLMPAHAEEKVTVFPGTFVSKEACMQLAQVLITRRDYRCIGSERATAFAAVTLPGDRTPAFTVLE